VTQLLETSRQPRPQRAASPSESAGAPRWALPALVLAGAACLAAAALVPASLEPAPRAWLMTAGFGLVVVALVLDERRSLAALWLAIVFLAYGGLSAVIAVGDPQAGVEPARFPTPEQAALGTAPPGYDRHPDSGDFANAALATVLAGVVCIGAAAAVGRLAQGARVRRREISRGRTETFAKRLVLLGFAGVAAALLRFCLTQLPTDDLQLSIKAFWEGGSYLLLLATFAIPGFGLWLHAALRRGASRRELLRIAGLMAFYLALLIPTGQRHFVVAMLIAVLAVLVYARTISVRQLAAVLAAGVVFFGVTQAARTVIADSGGFSFGSYLSRLAPGNWDGLYGSQLGSFNWTAQVEANKELLDIPNPFPRALLKPIPRQLYPGKSQGFGEEFTRRAYPQTFTRHVSFAIPLPAESDYAFGLAGVAALFLLLGAAAALGELYWARGYPAVLAPLVLATVAWSAFAFVRGDFANAMVVSAGWLIPVAVASWRLAAKPGPDARR